MFSPDRTRIVTSSVDKTVRVWSDIKPLALDDAKPWSRTTYCMPVARRQQLLGVTLDIATKTATNAFLASPVRHCANREPMPKKTETDRPAENRDQTQNAAVSERYGFMHCPCTCTISMSIP
ncbi:MAG: WD40 domain-containing protein [Proteobacteria bacterium]|nr:WD40 domain-containing protein [Pseudomonadota bacterium]